MFSYSQKPNILTVTDISQMAGIVLSRITKKNGKEKAVRRIKSAFRYPRHYVSIIRISSIRIHLEYVQHFETVPHKKGYNLIKIPGLAFLLNIINAFIVI